MIAFDRAVLGRQRDLAGARRRRPVGRVSARLRGDHAGALSAGDRDAARARVPRRRVRIPHAWRRPASTTGTSPSRPARRSRRFCQGVILGGLIQGITVENGAFAGGAFDWATPFALLCGLGVVAGYALLGATWLVMKTEGAVAERARGQAKLLLLARARLHGGGEPVDAARLRAHRRALVLDAEHLLSLAGADR